MTLATEKNEKKPRPPGFAMRYAAQTLRAFSSLRAALLLTVFLGVALPAGIAFVDEATSLREEFDMKVHDDLGQITTLLARSMREPMWQLADEQAGSLIEATFIDPRIVSVQVRDYEQRLLASRERALSGDEPTVVHTRPIEREGKKIGVVMVEMTLSGYHKQNDELLERYTRRTLISLAGSLLLIVLILHFRLVRPVDRLVDAASRLARGELELDRRSGTRFKRLDEFGRVAESIETTRRAISGLILTLEEKNNELREANLHLESRVSERTQQLEEAIATLKRAQRDMVESEKLASLGRIVAGVAHELNTPIGNALTVASTLDDHLQPLRREFADGNVRKSTLEHTLESSKHGFEILLRSLEKAARMIGDFKQVAVDQTSEQRRTFDLAAVTAEVLATLQPAFKKTPIRMEIHLTEGIACDGYPGPYGQVLTNLVLNALTHAFEGRDAGIVCIRVDRIGTDRARLVVADDGIGMNETIRSKLFDPFFTTRLGRGGSGLGMNIALSIVIRLLAGTIAVDTHPGTGSAFTVDFPCSLPEAPPVSAS